MLENYKDSKAENQEGPASFEHHLKVMDNLAAENKSNLSSMKFASIGIGINLMGGLHFVKDLASKGQINESDMVLGALFLLGTLGSYGAASYNGSEVMERFNGLKNKLLAQNAK